MKSGSEELKKKYSDLISQLQQYESGLLAFSGGVDSSFLLAALKDSGIKFIAVTSHSETTPDKDLAAAISFAKEHGAEHIVIRTEEMSNEAFASNPADRCFFCKEELFNKMRSIADEKKIRYVLDGSNADDLLDYRPGRKAAELYGVRSPLAESDFSKEDIRSILKESGMDIWSRPSSPCLASRFPHGQRITLDDLKKVEQAEEFLRTLGIKDLRVRLHGETARIEVPEEDMDIIMQPDERKDIIDKLKRLGFRFISLDLEGFRSGSLNRMLK